MLGTIVTAIATRTGLGSGAVAAALGALLVALLLALAGLSAWRAAAAFRSVVDQAAQSARDERDAHWRAEIATANAKVAEARLAQAAAASRAEIEVRATEARLETELNELEKRNAALAGGDRVGLGRARVRLLNAPR